MITAYVTYDRENGALTGAYIQEPHDDHKDNMIVVSHDAHTSWTSYVANSERDGVELAPALGPQPAADSVPQQITCGQGREALYNVGLFANVQPAIDAIDDPDTKWRVQNAWDYRPTWERQSPFVAMMAAILGLGDVALDQLFITAATL